MFLARALAPIMRSGIIASITSIDTVCTGEPRNAPEDTWVLGGGIDIPSV